MLLHTAVARVTTHGRYHTLHAACSDDRFGIARSAVYAAYITSQACLSMQLGHARAAPPGDYSQFMSCAAMF